jgi:pimeloyl-ACP methyl ester carboxylesterase
LPSEDAPGGITLPPGQRIELPGRGAPHVRQLAGPNPSAPTVVLLHGLGVDADLNWFPSYAALAHRYHVVAIDHRGHGRGIRTERFRLADCADDVAALCDVLELDRVIPVGYSMGGPIAQLLWHRHRDLVAGMVLCATAARFTRAAGRQVASRVIPGIAAFARMAPATLPANPNVRQLVASRTNDPGVRQWVFQRERRSDPRAVLEAAAAVGRFSSVDWLTAVDVPTAVVITQFDRLVPRPRQEELVRLIPTATEHRVLGDHAVCVVRPDLFLPKLLEALAAVTGQ